jgi:hypothetical protein
VLAHMQAKERVNLVFLDANRDDPLTRNFATSVIGGARPSLVGRGLAEMRIGDNTMFAFATSPGAVTINGTGRNSPFTAALLKHIREPGLEISAFMTRVRGDVYTATDRKQIPWAHSSFMGEFVLVPRISAATPPATAVQPVAPPHASPARDKADQRLAMRSEGSMAYRVPRPRAAGEDRASLSGPFGPTRYCASSALAPQPGNTYGVRHLFSTDLDTAWVEGRPGQGVGEWVAVEFERPKLVKTIVIRNGYQKNADVFQNNGRVRRLKLVFSQGETQTLTLEDRDGAQVIALDPGVKTYWVQFLIEDVYPGSRFTDTAISKLIVETEPAR